MSELSDFAEEKFLAITLKGATAYNVATPYLALFINDPTDAGTGTECSWTNYARQAMSFGTISGGSVSNDVAIDFPALVGDAVTITHMGIYDALSGGNLLWHTPIELSKTLTAGDIFNMAIDGSNVSLA